MKKVLVTGANGQLGSCIKNAAHKYPKLNFTFRSSKQLDITEKNKLYGFFKENEFDYCINCAAYTNVEQAEKSPDIAYKVNAEGAKNVALACKKNSVILIHISTDYVFDGEKKEAYTIEDIPNPINEYGKSKLLGEQYTQEILENYLIVRTSWLYSEIGTNFYTNILEKSKTQTVFYITDAQKGRPTNANSLATYILENIKQVNLKLGIVHFTGEKTTTWYDFAKSILNDNDLLDKVHLVRDSNYRTFAKRPLNSVLI